MQKPKGTQDIFLKEAKKWRWLSNEFIDVLKKYNFNEIITPIFESKEVFVRGVGSETDVVQKEMFEFEDKSKRINVLRPELTAPVVRSFIENKMYANENLPLKFFYNGPAFRYERPQAGRYRQFNQFGIEVFGNDSLEQDIEIILLANKFIKTCKVDQLLSIEINYLISGDARKKYEIALLDEVNKIKEICADCEVRKEKNILRVLDCKIDGHKYKQLPKMSKYINETDKLRFEQIVSQLKTLNVNVKINEKLVRGLDYYTGIVFEVTNVKTSQAVIAGGRYNNLVENMGGPSIPAIGFAVGWERMLILIEENQTLKIEDNQLDVFIIPISDKGRIITNKLMNEMRDESIIVDTNWNISKLKNGFKASEKVLTKNLIIIGDESICTNAYEIKSKVSDKIVKVKYDEIISYLKLEKGCK
ncbi:histidyl-tRNA synthetase [Entomoplasma ellychniae]|uniref:Histidine--tRNA ligase n=1 Tax=Entomoplasma ellychniae TaxID=2114 RepID=A0A8E2QVM7_9MOLU|nr:histidine--tRNA ligase [Entomoplasma ellychniae]PPE04527.1 histidyl-tRNA synthetase [Entomoplasma ellychniae]